MSPPLQRVFTGVAKSAAPACDSDRDAEEGLPLLMPMQFPMTQLSYSNNSLQGADIKGERRKGGEAWGGGGGAPTPLTPLV